MKKLYIAGKITGDPDYKEKFEKVRKEFEDDYIILNPATLPEGMLPSDYIRICFAMIDVADIVLFLPNYKESKGATLEKEYCEYVGKRCINYVPEQMEDAFRDLWCKGLQRFISAHAQEEPR